MVDYASYAGRDVCVDLACGVCITVRPVMVYIKALALQATFRKCGSLAKPDLLRVSLASYI